MGRAYGKLRTSSASSGTPHDDHPDELFTNNGKHILMSFESDENMGELRINTYDRRLKALEDRTIELGRTLVGISWRKSRWKECSNTYYEGNLRMRMERHVLCATHGEAEH